MNMATMCLRSGWLVSFENLSFVRKGRIVKPFFVNLAPFTLVHCAHRHCLPLAIPLHCSFEHTGVETGADYRIVIGARDLSCIHEIMDAGSKRVSAPGQKGTDKFERHLVGSGQSDGVTYQAQHQPWMLQQGAKHPVWDRAHVIANERDSSDSR